MIGFEQPSCGTERPVGQAPLRTVPKRICALPVLFRCNEKLLVMWDCDTLDRPTPLEQLRALFQTFTLLFYHLLEIFNTLL